jgi:hypothetical protein
METVSEKRLVDLACSDMDTRPDLWEVESMAREILDLRKRQADLAPAMTWSSSPIHAQWHWIKGVKGPRVLYLCRGEWRFGGACGAMIPLNGRTVCLIPAPPSTTQRGDP